jgi:hypothetical protein
MTPPIIPARTGKTTSNAAVVTTFMATSGVLSAPPCRGFPTDSGR